QVANNAAAAHPDLVIHVGDYLYREKNCDGVKNCPGGPAGDMMATWEADFFTPARKLLRAAPWVFVRGNHETCVRAGDGWFSLLDPRTVSGCQEFTQPYLVQAGALRLAVVDDSTATDARCAPGEAKCATQFAREVEEYARQFQTISSWGVDHAWLLSHRPVWSVKRGDEGAQVLNAALEAAWAKQRPSGVDLLLAGHTHVFEAIGFAPESGHATQLVVGNSGTKLAPPLKFDPKDAEVVHAQIREFQKIQDFGFTTLQPEGDSWRAEAHDRDGKVHVRCSVPMNPGRCADEGK
ncbi:MAG: metallophosphoesterase, partial [Bryobacterales bacterium]|nr:metallophosphoesterase [Bryobacterales bacterium]